MVHCIDFLDLGAVDALVVSILKPELPQRLAHVRGVARRARLARSLFVQSDANLLISAALLHDIGYSSVIRSTGLHALDGAQFLRDQGAPSRLCALVAHHSAADLEAGLRGLTAEISEWFDEQTSLRDALWWADMTTTPEGEPTNVHDRIEEIQKRYGPEALVTFFIRQARSELVAAVERTEERLRSVRVDYTAK